MTNTGDGTARAVALEVAVSDGTNLRSFDLPQMLPGCTPATVFKNPNGTGGISGVRCTLVDIAPGATQYVSVRVPTNGIPDGTRARRLHPGDLVERRRAADVAARHDDGDRAPTGARPTPMSTIAAPEVISIATPTTAQTATIVNTTAPVSLSNQVLIKVATPRKVAAGSLATPLGARASRDARAGRDRGDQARRTAAGGHLALSRKRHGSEMVPTERLQGIAVDHRAGTSATTRTRPIRSRSRSRRSCPARWHRTSRRASSGRWASSTSLATTAPTSSPVRTASGSAPATSSQSCSQHRAVWAIRCSPRFPGGVISEEDTVQFAVGDPRMARR